MEIQVNDKNFEAEVLKAALPVLVDFYADWCGPCKMMAPTVAELAEEYAGVIKVAKCNTDESMQTAIAYGIASIPTLMIFKDGKIVYKTIGVTDMGTLKAAIAAV